MTVLVIVMSGALRLRDVAARAFRADGCCYGVILASFMVPIQALIVTHFVLMNELGLINTWRGIILPQLIVPVVVIVYKQFFDCVPKELREAARDRRRQRIRHLLPQSTCR